MSVSFDILYFEHFSRRCAMRILHILPLVHVVYYFTAVVRDMRVLASFDRSSCVRYESDKERERHEERLMRLIQSTLQQTQMKISSESLRFRGCNNQTSTTGKLICRLCKMSLVSVDWLVRHEDFVTRSYISLLMNNSDKSGKFRATLVRTIKIEFNAQVPNRTLAQARRSISILIEIITRPVCRLTRCRNVWNARRQLAANLFHLCHLQFHAKWWIN